MGLYPQALLQLARGEVRPPFQGEHKVRPFKNYTFDNEWLCKPSFDGGSALSRFPRHFQ